MTPQPIYCHPRRLSLWINPNLSARVPTQTRHTHSHGQRRDQRLNLQTLCVRDQHLRVNVRVVQLNLALPRTRVLVWEALTFGGTNTNLGTIVNGRRNSRGSNTVSPTKVCCVDCVVHIIKLHAINRVFGSPSLA